MSEISASIVQKWLSRITLLENVKSRTKITSISQTKQLHSQLIINGFNSLSFFSKLIQPSNSHYILPHFHIPEHKLYLFNKLLRSTLPPSSSFRIFANSKNRLFSDHFTFLFVIGACSRSLLLWEGKQVHTLLLKNGIFMDVMVSTTLVHFYVKNKDIYAAQQMFDEMPVRTCVSWNAIITGYCSRRDKDARNAVVLFKDMLLDMDVCGRVMKPTDTTMVCLLSAVSQLGVLECGVCVHGYLVKIVLDPENDVFIGTGLIDMYSKCGCLSTALSIFWRMKVRNVLTWTAIATGLAIHGKGKEALELLDKMVSDVGIKPNAVTFASLISACSHSGLVDEGLHLFHNMESNFGVTPNVQHYGCVVDLLGKAGLLKEAYGLIKTVKNGDAVLWRSFLNACKVHGDVKMGEEVGNMLLNMPPKEVSSDYEKSEDFVALSNVYASAARWEDVEKVREVMVVNSIETKPGYSYVQSVGNFLFG